MQDTAGNSWGDEAHFQRFAALVAAAAREACAKNIGDTTAAWTPIEQPYPLAGKLDILMGDGSILCGVIPQEEGDLWWSGTAEKFIDPQYYDITHWRVHCDTTAIRARGQE